MDWKTNTLTTTVIPRKTLRIIIKCFHKIVMQERGRMGAVMVPMLSSVQDSAEMRVGAIFDVVCPPVCFYDHGLTGEFTWEFPAN